MTEPRPTYRTRRRSARSEPERALETQLQAVGVTGWEPEYMFHPTRRWRFDFAWPDVRVAVEFDGGQWVMLGGRHNRDSDRDKLNHAAALGWRVLRFSNQQWSADPLACLRLLQQALTQ